MQDKFFFSDIESEAGLVNYFIDQLKEYSTIASKQLYVLNSPLADKKYNYQNREGLVLLIPDYRIIFVNLGSSPQSFDDYCEDFLEDLGHLSDKYEYKQVLGRPRSWRDYYVRLSYSDFSNGVGEVIDQYEIQDENDKRKVELLISLLIGSINSIEKVGQGLPENVLDKVMRKIILFDSDQTQFIFKKVNKKRITIQGLAGTGKTELLLHKLKELYAEDSKNRVAFTCFNKALADKLRIRVPEFFTFMKVDEQIKWNERLWVMHSWGSQYDRSNIGLYSYICNYYKLDFLGLSNGSFDKACKSALKQLETLSEFEPCFDYVLIDESQDFENSFFELCEKVTTKSIYVAGDIFQNIFRDSLPEVTPDFLLNKCYRTDNKTLMFAHALGLGLFERPVLRWLTDEEWDACGYTVQKRGSRYYFSRDTLRRFEDLRKDQVDSVKLIRSRNQDCRADVLRIMKEIQRDNPTVKPDDIAIIFVDTTNQNYKMMDDIAIMISNEFQWKTNKIYSSKINKEGTVFISNKNNVKGLEFPFVICIANYQIHSRINSRNTLYMALTRSFITSYLIVSEESNPDLLQLLDHKLNTINEHDELIVEEPRPEDILDRDILLNILDDPLRSQSDIVTDLLQKYKIPEVKHESVRKVVAEICNDSVDEKQIEQVIKTTKGFFS